MHWTSLKIFPDGDKDEFIKNNLIPLIEKVNDSKIINSYFFELHNDEGSYIKVNIKSKHTSLAIFKIINKELKPYLSLKSASKITEVLDLNQNSCITLIPYHPEHKLSGGSCGTLLSEKNFKNSSAVVFHYIKNESIYSYNNRLNIAMKMHLASAYIYCNGSLENMIFFLYYFFKNCITPKINFLKFEKYEINYNEHFNQQKETFILFVGTIFSRLTNKMSIDNAITTWQNQETQLKLAMTKLYENGSLKHTEAGGNDPLWPTLSYHMHMTNNRLGIKQIDEALIAYILMNSLKYA